jgi:hypothetical protein
LSQRLVGKDLVGTSDPISSKQRDLKLTVAGNKFYEMPNPAGMPSADLPMLLA